MINGVRQFKLINALGREYDMTRPDALLHAPDGLGWGTERTVNRLGMTYIGINEKEIHQSPSGEMVFRTYEEYGTFLSFCQQGGLVLCYKPIDTWYYCECLISIQKSEIQWENNHLICPVQFTLLSYWYEKVVAQTAEPPEPVEPNYATVTGDPAVFNARYSYPIKDLSVAIQGGQDLNGYDKPWVGGRGKNKLPPIESQTYNGITFDVAEDGTITVNGTATGNANRYFIAQAVGAFDAYMPTGYYRLSGCPEGGSPTTYRLQVRVDNTYFSDNGNGATFNYTNGSAVNCYCLIQIASGATVNNLVFKPMIALVSAGEAYEPYANICPITSYDSVTITQTGSQTNTYTVELTGAGNVYKGTLDVTSGELTVEQVMVELDGSSDENWDAPATGLRYAYRTTNLPITSVATSTSIEGRMTNGIRLSTSSENTASWQTLPSMRSTTYASKYAYLFFPPSWNVTTVAELRTWLADNPVQYVYPVEQTYTLTPTQLSNLIGQNTIKADAGAVTVTYRTDARTEYKIYPYQYSYKYGDTAQNVFDISCDLPSYFKLTVFGEATNPSWRVVQNGSIVKSGKLNATIGSSQKLVINTDPKQTEIALYTLSNTRINNLYGYSDFATERIFALPQGESQVQVLTEDEQSPKVMIEVLKHV